ncbi:hypothetical protein KKD19_00095 [Patescibacteria group bacterium]|nr:hypothetical protein [Patescibacteria group bacterium]MBU4511638.1 hypothetical protein [Patescibacteria group bacterium]MCG2692708.1 hypothetical protein [Candidatus Parcubacteria bacterium]
MANEEKQIRPEQEPDVKRKLEWQKRQAGSIQPIGDIPSREAEQGGGKQEREAQEKSLDQEQPELKSTGERHLAQILKNQREKALHSQKAKQAQQKLESIEGVEKTYKGIKNIIRVIKMVTGGLGSIGEIFASAPSFILIAHLEWLYSFFNKKYKIAWWEKAFVLIADCIIGLIFLFVVLLVAILAYVFANPIETVKEIGLGGLKEIIGGE